MKLRCSDPKPFDTGGGGGGTFVYNTNKTIPGGGLVQDWS